MRGACVGKRTYAFQSEALQAVPPGRKMTAYQCELCGGWHLTSKNRKGKR